MSRRKQTKPQHLPSEEVQSAGVSIGIRTGNRSVVSATSDGNLCVQPVEQARGENTADRSGSLSDSQLVRSSIIRRNKRGKKLHQKWKSERYLLDRTCKYCGAVRNSPADLKRHIRKHTGERPFVCSLCSRAFKAKRSLQYHQYMHHGIEFRGSHDCVRFTRVGQPRLDVESIQVSDAPALGQCSPSSSLDSHDGSSHSAPEMKEGPACLCTTMPSESIEPCSFSRSHESQETGLRSNGDEHVEAFRKDECREPRSVVMFGNADLARSSEDANNPNLSRREESPEPCHEDMDEEKFNLLLSRRTCQFCSKVCPKPSDLKRHLMVHTGERPFKCDMCGKAFKAKGSMQYHQKAAHGADIELSQGLEERYMRLKHRPCPPYNHKDAGFTPADNDSQSSTDVGSPSNKQEEAERSPGGVLDLSTEPSSLLLQLNSKKPLSPNRPSLKTFDLEKSDVQVNADSVQETEKTAENTTMLEEGKAQVESPECTEGGSSCGLILKEEAPFVKNKISVKNETVLVTRLDGVNLITGVKTSLYKCHMCGKMFNYLSRLQCHLSVHFERHMTTYQCSVCGANFKFKTQLLRHSRSHSRLNKTKDECEQCEKPPNGNGSISKMEGTANSVIDGKESGDESEVDADQVELDLEENLNSKIGSSESANGFPFTSNKRHPHRCRSINGRYACLFCKKTFFRLFSLRRHERMHTGVKPCYCKECGKGFSEPRNLRQHILRFHNEGFQMDFVRKARRRAIIASLRSSARASRAAELAERDGQRLPRMASPEPQPESIKLSSKFTATNMPSPSAKDLSQRDDVQDDVTVVYPAEAPSGQRPDSLDDSWSEGEEGTSQEIMTAPKRPLLSFRKDSFGCKSRRKSTVPVKIENMSPPNSCCVQESQDCSNQGPTDLSQTAIKEEATSPVAVGLSVPTAQPATPLSPVLFTNQGAAATHPLFLSSHLLPTSGLSVNPVMSIPITVQVPVDPQSAVTSTPSPANMGLMAQVSPSDFLVGYPRVKWDGNPLAGIPASEPIPRRRSLPLEASYRLQEAYSTDKNGISTDGRKVTSLSRTHSRLHMHHPLASATSTACSTLTGFYSRLHVVNAPVNREKVCKPMLLPDGRSIYRCVFCNKDFPTYSDINRHMDFHEDIRPYKCKFCDYYARTNSQLKVHMMRHQGIREFCCKLCNYKGVTQSDLNRHMKSQIHMLKSRNQCPHCMEGFVTPKNLERHMMEICQGRNRAEKSL